MNYHLISKINFLFSNSRVNMDVTWSETGDRYMLKLYRDYLFHTVGDDGRPWLDHAHVVQSLNKLDAGTMDKVKRFNFFYFMNLYLCIFNFFRCN